MEFFESSVGLDEAPTLKPTKSNVCVFVNYPCTRLFEIRYFFQIVLCYNLLYLLIISIMLLLPVITNCCHFLQ